jgi:hypothetical protein
VLHGLILGIFIRWRTGRDRLKYRYGLLVRRPTSYIWLPSSVKYFPRCIGLDSRSELNRIMNRFGRSSYWNASSLRLVQSIPRRVPNLSRTVAWQFGMLTKGKTNGVLPWSMQCGKKPEHWQVYRPCTSIAIVVKTHVRRTKHTTISRDLRKRYRYQSDLKPPCPHPNRSSCMRLKSSILRHRLYASRCSLVACAFGSLAARRGRRVRHRSKKSHLYMIPIPFPGTSTVSHVPKDRSSSRLVLLFAAEPNLRKLGSTSSKSRNALTAHRRRAGHTITRLSDTELA